MGKREAKEASFIHRIFPHIKHHFNTIHTRKIVRCAEPVCLNRGEKPQTELKKIHANVQALTWQVKMERYNRSQDTTSDPAVTAAWCLVWPGWCQRLIRHSVQQLAVGATEMVVARMFRPEIWSKASTQSSDSHSNGHAPSERAQLQKGRMWRHSFQRSSAYPPVGDVLPWAVEDIRRCSSSQWALGYGNAKDSYESTNCVLPVCELCCTFSPSIVSQIVRVAFSCWTLCQIRQSSCPTVADDAAVATDCQFQQSKKQQTVPYFHPKFPELQFSSG